MFRANESWPDEDEFNISTPENHNITSQWVSRLKVMFSPVQIRISDIHRLNLFDQVLSFGLDLQKLEREARICRLLKHANIGGYINRMVNRIYYLFFSDEKTSDAKEIDKKKRKQSTCMDL